MMMMMMHREGRTIAANASVEGCILGAATPSKRGISSEQVGSQAAQELLEDLASGGCIDQWYGLCSGGGL